MASPSVSEEWGPDLLLRAYIAPSMLLLQALQHICVPAETFFLFSRCQVLIVVLSQDTVLCMQTAPIVLAPRPLLCDNWDQLAIWKTMCQDASVAPDTSRSAKATQAAVVWLPVNHQQICPIC